MNSFSIFSFLGSATDNSMSINNGWTIVAAVLSTMIGMLGIFYVYLRFYGANAVHNRVPHRDVPHRVSIRMLDYNSCARTIPSPPRAPTHLNMEQYKNVFYGSNQMSVSKAGLVHVKPEFVRLMFAKESLKQLCERNAML